MEEYTFSNILRIAESVTQNHFYLLLNTIHRSINNHKGYLNIYFHYLVYFYFLFSIPLQKILY